MTERSRPWDGTTTGDATDAPYDAATEWARLFRALSPIGEQNANKGGVLIGASGFGGYGATTPGANTTRIASGLGWNQGTWHESDANVDFIIATPGASTRVDRIVLRKSWAGQTVRLTKIAGTEGAGAPALTQVYGTTWDVPLWLVSITTGGAITYTDQRLDLQSTGLGNFIVNAAGAYTMLPADTAVIQQAALAVTLPLANAVPRGTRVEVKSTINGASAIRQSADTIWSFAAAQTSLALNQGDAYSLRSDGVSVWYVMA